MNDDTLLPDAAKEHVIRAEHFNTIVRRLKDFWIGESYSYGVAHTDNPTIVSTYTDDDGNIIERSQTPYLRHGWGQPNILPAEVAVGQIITYQHVNHLIAIINVAVYHLNKEINLPLTPMPLISFEYDSDSNTTTIDGENILVDIYYYNRIMEKIDYIEKEKFEAENISTNVDYLEIETTQGFSWQDDLYCVFGATFNSYDEARHYFNSGGQIYFELECGGAVGGSLPVWERFFNQLGELRIGAVESTSQTPVTPLVNKGFYDIEFGTQWTTIFEEAIANWTNSEYGQGGEYIGDYYKPEYAGLYLTDLGGSAYGEYNSRRVRVQARIIETETGQFKIEFKVVLLEDQENDILPITNIISVIAGYIDLLETPVFPIYNNATPPVQISGVEQYFSNYKFVATTPPTITIEQQWNEVDASIVDILPAYTSNDYVEEGYVA